MFVELENWKTILGRFFIFKNEEQDYRKLRKKYSKKILSKEEKEAIQSFSKDLLDIAEAGLMKRLREEKISIINKELD